MWSTLWKGRVYRHVTRATANRRITDLHDTFDEVVRRITVTASTQQGFTARVATLTDIRLELAQHGLADGRKKRIRAQSLDADRWRRAERLFTLAVSFGSRLVLVHGLQVQSYLRGDGVAGGGLRRTSRA